MMNLRKYSKSWTNIKEKMKDKNSIGDTTLSIRKTTKLYTLKGWDLWNMNFISIKLLYKK